MNIPLARLIDGIIATLRADVIPNVADSYARGQAVAVIDLLNNIAPRVEWSHATLVGRIADKRRLLDEVAALVPGLPVADVAAAGPDAAAAALAAEKAALDAVVGDVVAALWPRRGEPPCAEATRRIRAHLQDEMRAEMKITRKPLFAEIASGSGGAGA
ncbi:hypothetical protein [Aquibium microcysteis]|uniref:hypothetical protein n=1 Tax=Aquibium microcysteis TaxID=675281 RepID=UPI00165D2151|nr:hypothetical protein [Aquibium microcysteis]